MYRAVATLTTAALDTHSSGAPDALLGLIEAILTWLVKLEAVWDKDVKPIVASELAVLESTIESRAAHLVSLETQIGQHLETFVNDKIDDIKSALAAISNQRYATEDIAMDDRPIAAIASQVTATGRSLAGHLGDHSKAALSSFGVATCRVLFSRLMAMKVSTSGAFILQAECNDLQRALAGFGESSMLTPWVEAVAEVPKLMYLEVGSVFDSISEGRFSVLEASELQALLRVRTDFDRQGFEDHTRWNHISKV